MNHEAPSYNQIAEQQTKDIPATVLTRRSNGEIQTAKYAGQHFKEQGSDKYYVQLNELDENGEPLYRPISSTELSDDGQALLANEFAESSVVRSPESWERVAKVEKDLGETAVEQAVELVDSEPIIEAEVVQKREAAPERKAEIKLKSENIERSAAELDRVFAGELANAFEGVADDATSRRAAIDPNSGDPELRHKVEGALRSAIDDLGYKQMLPERVQDNSPGNLKNIPSSRFGYETEKYLSRDYAAKLALAMLDGSFDGDPNKRDYDDLPADDPRNGQHRQAARMVLEHFAAQKNSNSEQKEHREQDSEDDESFENIRRTMQQLGDDEMFQRATNSIHDLSDQYYQGLPHFFDPQEVMQQLQQHNQQLRAVSEDVESVLRRMYSAADEVKSENRAVLEQFQMEMTNVHTQIEHAMLIQNMLVGKLDELSYDPNAQMEVRALFAQQFPLALSSMSQAFARVRSLTNQY